MSEYAVNKQTGEVLKRDQSGLWQKVKSAKNASGEILINEGSGWGAVPSAAAQPAPFASPFLQRGMGMVQGAMATPEPRPVSRMEAASLGAQRGGSFATADEAEGVRNALNMIPQAPGPIGSLTNFAMGLGGMAMEALPGQPPQSYTQGRDALRAKEEAARAQHPVTFGGSEIAASVLVPVGGTARAATKTGQVIKGTAAGAGSGAVYGFAAEDGSLEERAKAGATGGVVGGAFGGLLSTVIPRDIPLSDVLNTELFGTKVSRPVLKTIERMLVDAGVPANRVEAGVVNIRQRLQSGQVGAGLPTRFKDELVKEFGDSARGVSEAIETQIRGGAARSGSASDAAVRRAVSEDNAAARELFSRSVDQFAGSTSRPELRGQAIGQLEEIVESRYKPILAAGIADPAKQQTLVGVLAQPRMQSLASELAEDAEREGIDLAALIARNPAEAAHWMQSKARQLADDKGKVSITGRVIPDRTMSNRRQDILNALEDAVPGYRETRKEYGDKFGVMQAMNFAKGFLTRAKDDVAVADMAEEFADMSEAQKQMALASLRSVVTGSAENVRYVDPELATGALRTAEIGKEPVLKALSEVFGEQGTKLADDIKAIVSRTDANRRINPQATGSDTVPKAQAIKKAIENTRGPVQRFVGSVFGGMPLDVGASMVAGVPAPLASARAGIQGAGKMADNRAMSTVDKVTELLLSQPQAGRTRNALASPGTPPTGGGQIIDQLSQVPPGSAPAPRTVGVAPASPAMPTPAPVPPSQPPAMAAPVMPPPAPTPSPAPAPARSGPPPFPPPLEAMEWTGPIPREPGGLLAFIRKLGGIREEFGRFQEQGYMRGSVAQVLGDVRSRPGLLNNKSGQTIDELARSARDAGFDIGDDEDFMRQLADELQGRGKSYRIGEAEEWNAYQEFLRNKTRAENSERVYDEIPFGFGGTDATNALAGGTLGGIAPAESSEERLRNMAIGAGIGGFARRGSQMLDDATRTVGQPRATSGRTVGQGGYFGRQSMRPPGSGPSPREIETQQQWATATPIVTQARTTAQSAQQAADAALQSKAPADIARAKDAKKTLVGQLQEAQASRAGMDTPEDARLAETLASLSENTSDPVLLSTQISAAKTSLDRLLTDIGSPVEGNLIPVKTNILTRTQAPRSAAEGPQDRASVTRYAEGEAPPVKGMGFGVSPETKTPAPPFYSALERAVTGTKMARAPSEQWKATLKNMPGVKEEEIEFTGLNEWLDLQTGPVSRDDVANYVRQNGVQVEEVVRGEGVTNARRDQIQRETLPLIERRQALDEALNNQPRYEGWSTVSTIADQMGLDMSDPRVDEAFSAQPAYIEYKRFREETQREVEALTAQISTLQREYTGLIGVNAETDAKWSSYTLPGGENYREMLLTLPMSEGSVPPGYRLFERDGRWVLRYPDEMDVDFATRNEAIASLGKAESYRSSHWSDPNVLAHTRFKDRQGPQGQRVLALEEIQSDWHQAGRERGYKLSAKEKAALEKKQIAIEQEVVAQGHDATLGQSSRWNIIENQLNPERNRAVPNAPLKQTSSWTSLVLNRMIRKASDEGYDGIAWIPGDIQNGARVAAGDNRSDFYDKIVVNAANKIGKKYGARVEKMPGLAVDKDGKPVDFYYLSLTPDMKAKAQQEGFPLFAAAPFAAVGGAGLTSERELGSKMKRDKKD
jgi:hypothetical protein